MAKCPHVCFPIFYKNVYKAPLQLGSDELMNSGQSEALKVLLAHGFDVNTRP